MRLIYVSHWRFPSDKTMSPLIMRSCEELARQGMEVELWIPQRVNPQYPSVDPFNHYKIERLFSVRKLTVLDIMPFLPGIGFVLMVLTFAAAVWWKGRQMPGDVIWYAHDLRDVLFLRKRNLFIEIHDFYESRLEFLNRMVLERARGLIVTNKIKIDRIEKAYGIPRSRMRHLPNAVDVARFNRRETKEEARKKLSLPLDRSLVVYTGSIFGWKGIHTLALATRFLSEDTEVIFAGGNDQERREFRKFIDKEQIPRVTLTPLPYEDVERAPLLMRAADVLVLPNTAKDRASRLETSPVKLFEYMASGTPIVASDLPSIRDIVDETMVMFFEADNPASLAQAVAQVETSSQASRHRAERAAKEVSQYAWDRRIGKVSEFIKILL